MCDKLGIGDGSGAALAKALLEDLSVVTPDDKKYVVDKYKIRRERLRIRSTEKRKKQSDVREKLKVLDLMRKKIRRPKFS